ncbi:hypothetical protein DEU56DRAFT_800986 [Suillus clintonianus]|uniref:uncharacterized protein n=1 Tax=Suillus clintonianus TaxID=1904413 RepID=UPI001B8782D4|nr:uncharacterized protein DEU56DRAFT_800986 [Suillus clintonianus]KAG2138944.1 hypothetical protein DEU56DRAFT_800986 [Suillus clintonianus]
MPPKRKRADADPRGAPARSTRSSTRTGKNAAASEVSAGASVVKGSSVDGVDVAPPQKKTRNTGLNATSRAKATKGGANTTNVNDDKLTSTRFALNDDEAGETNKVAPKAFQEATTEPYTPQRAQVLFDSFADEDDRDVIGPGGLVNLCEKVKIPLEGAQPLILAWQLKCSEMGKYTREEWLHGMGLLEISSLPVLALALRELDDLLICDKQALARSASTSSQAKKRGGANTREPYNRTRYREYASDRKAAFADLYQFCFTLAKPPQARNIDIETATALWSVLLVPRYPIIKELNTFLTEKGTYKGANKDIWNMVGASIIWHVTY